MEESLWKCTFLYFSFFIISLSLLSLSHFHYKICLVDYLFVILTFYKNDSIILVWKERMYSCKSFILLSHILFSQNHGLNQQHWRICWYRRSLCKRVCQRRFQSCKYLLSCIIPTTFNFFKDFSRPTCRTIRVAQRRTFQKSSWYQYPHI